MNHSEFREKILAMTDTELKTKSGEYTREEFLEKVLEDAEQDENGYYYFTNEKMIRPQFIESYPLRTTYSYMPAPGKPRLLIHTRFTELPFHYN